MPNFVPQRTDDPPLPAGWLTPDPVAQEKRPLPYPGPCGCAVCSDARARVLSVPPVLDADVLAAPVLRGYYDVRHLIADGDLLLKRSAGVSLIASAGRSIYCHAAMAGWWDDRLFCLEMVEWVGGRAVLFSNHVKALPGRWDVYKANPEGMWPFDRRKALAHMKDLTGTPYGWRNIQMASLRHFAVARLFCKAPSDDRPDGTPPFCSGAVSEATQEGGTDPVPHLANAATEPGDLARSPFFRYNCTLTWDAPHNVEADERPPQTAAA